MVAPLLLGLKCARRFRRRRRTNEGSMVKSFWELEPVLYNTGREGKSE